MIGGGGLRKVEGERVGIRFYYFGLISIVMMCLIELKFRKGFASQGRTDVCNQGFVLERHYLPYLHILCEKRTPRADR